MEFTGFLPPDEFWATYENHEQQIRGSFGGLPLFRLANRPGAAMMGFWQFDGSEGSVAYEAVFPENSEGSGSQLEVITTTRNPLELAELRWITASGAPRSREELLERQDAFASQPYTAISVAIDGLARTFRLWRSADSWLAAADHGGFGIAMVAQGPGRPTPESLALETVADIEPLLAARRAWLRKARGED
ncbi:hypothetical protein [Arthrobacter celericrescens]|uniref:hypothetical protein n=1 Tax=Arthrobacter celericrescens TaxID=2320851 RepID=UPI000EA0CFE3|nr:hypothetical protein [Arthrobacter celericrescens]